MLYAEVIWGISNFLVRGKPLMWKECLHRGIFTFAQLCTNYILLFRPCYTVQLPKTNSYFDNTCHYKLVTDTFSLDALGDAEVAISLT